jgi:hypothetical protein
VCAFCGFPDRGEEAGRKKEKVGGKCRHRNGNNKTVFLVIGDTDWPSSSSSPSNPVRQNASSETGSGKQNSVPELAKTDLSLVVK